MTANDPALHMLLQWHVVIVKAAELLHMLQIASFNTFVLRQTPLQSCGTSKLTQMKIETHDDGYAFWFNQRIAVA